MSNILTVERAIIQLGDIDLDVFRLPNGGYRLSEEGTATAAEKSKSNARQFRASQYPEALPYKDYRPVKGQVDGERTRINLIPFDLAVAYWGKEAFAGNTRAQALVLACAKEALERRADAALRFKRVKRNTTKTQLRQLRVGKQHENSLVTLIKLLLLHTNKSSIQGQTLTI